MTCRQVTERLSEYWSGELDERLKDAITAHLQQCPACAQEWQAFQRAMAALRSAAIASSALEPPPDLLARIQATIQLRQRLARPVPLWRWQWAIAAAAAVAIVCTAIFVPLRHFLSVRERPVTVAELAVPEAFPAPSLRVPSLPPSRPPSPVPRPLLSERSLPPPPKERLRRGKVAPPPSRPQIALPPSEPHLGSSSELQEQPAQPQLLLPEPPPEREERTGAKELPQPPAVSPLPQIAELPAQPREVPFRAELALREQPKREPAAPLFAKDKPGLGLAEEQRSVAPGAAAPQETRAGQPPAVTQVPMGQHAPLGRLGQLGGGQVVPPVALPVQVRWGRFESLVVGKVRIWELVLTAETNQAVTVTLQRSEQVEVLNLPAPPKAEASEWVLWEGVLPASREVVVPLLLRATQVGAKRLLLTIRPQEGQPQGSSWWLIFPVTEREEPPRWRRALSLQTDRWVLGDLLLHLAWETKLAFLLPAHQANLVVSVPTSLTAFPKLLSVLEQQVGGRWEQSRNALVFIPTMPPVSPTVPAVKQ